MEALAQVISKGSKKYIWNSKTSLQLPGTLEIKHSKAIRNEVGLK